MTISRRTYWLPIAIASAFLAVAVFAVVSYLNTVRIRQNEQRVQRSFAIREATRELLSAMKDAETSQRGYLLTGDVAFLKHYDTGVEDAQQRFAQLRTLEAGDEKLIAQLNTFRDAFDRQQDHFQETIAMRMKAPKAAISEDILSLVKSGRGKQAMDIARQTSRVIVSRETERLKEAESTNQYLARVSRSTITVGNTIALALIFATAFAAYVDRKRRDAAEAGLLSKQTELEAVVDSAYEGIITRDANFTIRLINPAAASMLGVDAEQTVGRSLLDFVPDDRRGFVGSRAEQNSESEANLYEYDCERMRRADGTEFAVSGNSVRTELPTGILVTVKFRDMSDFQDSQAKQREYAAILEQISDAVLVCDLEGRVRSCNNSAETLFAQSEGELVGQLAEKLLGVDSEVWEINRDHLFENGLVTTQRVWLSPDGKEFVLDQRRSLIRDDGGQPIGKLLFLIDITQRVREEAQQRRTQRLESIGTLAGGIAHDLNNVLTPIVMSAKLLRRGSKTPERLVDNIITSADRGGKMIAKLLAFAGGDREVKAQIDLRETLSEVEEILSHTLQHTIDLKVNVPAKLHKIDGDSTELIQVIMNLAINARDAMPHGGTLEICVENFNVDRSRAAHSDILNEGPHVLLTVADNGDGIPKDVIDRIFDPFFTTKVQGKGTGLGLATTRGIVRSYDGDVTVYSEPGIGTKFSIYLPSSKLAEKIAEMDDEPEALSGNGEMVLIVDDESLILETARETLELAGYQTIIASSGTDAVVVYQSQGDSIDIILLDMMMPGLDGSETREAIRGMNPNARVIASSGLRRPGQAGGKMEDFDGFLAKPYTDAQLLGIVRSVLDLEPKGSTV
ncbi:CHASE3 domain-containing protein [Planctomycetes bacterium TBK1r]|uniref:histidine kinase n=1 Tax=Stieleria magnilauensis TaxID=2527963 RepID=A0ABX5XUZ9_9BACT|nr:Blue-light-activated protein [Planctomycetes bacterium TBK1r]